MKKPDVAHCRALGRALAELHRLLRATAYVGQTPGAFRLAYVVRTLPRPRNEIAPKLEEVIAAELTNLTSTWPATILETGIIHADLFPQRLLLEWRDLGSDRLLFACNDALAYDAAICLNAWCFERRDLQSREGGRHAERLCKRPPVWRSRPARPSPSGAWRTLRFLLTRSHDWLNTPKDALVKPHDPIAYLKRLEFLKTITQASELGLEEPSND